MCIHTIFTKRARAVYEFKDEPGYVFMAMDTAKCDLNVLLKGATLPHADIKVLACVSHKLVLFLPIASGSRPLSWLSACN
jgi:hypothetical protein